MGKLTTHVLDTALGRPASGVPVRLHRVRDGVRELVAETVTNADGRCDAPVLEGSALEPGEYEIVFHAGDYLARTAPAGSAPSRPAAAGSTSSGATADGPAPFLSTIPIRFGVADADEHYHVPLLLSPFGYSTYRGS